MHASDEFRDNLLACLGGPWPVAPSLDVAELGVERLDGLRRVRIAYQTEPDERVGAWLLVPDGANARSPAPGICVWHQHRGAWHVGAAEPAGLAGDPMHHTGLALAREGYVVLCPDALGFGEREKGYQLVGAALERFLFLQYVLQGRCLAWKHILDMRRAVDVLASRPEVDAQRLGCYGHSMGSTHTWLVGPWEPRLKALVGNCCFPTYGAMARLQISHCFANYVPGLLRFGDIPDVAALIAPRAFHLNLGEHDLGSPLPEARAGIARIEEAYRNANAPERFSHFIEPGAGHVLSAEMWQRTRAFFARHLGA